MHNPLARAANMLDTCNTSLYPQTPGWPKRLQEQAPRQPWDQNSVRNRLREAAYTIQRLPMPKNGRPPEHRVAWPDVVYDWLAYGWQDARAPRIPPTPAEISRCDEVLGWLFLLTRDQRLVLWARAQPHPFAWRKLEALDELERHGRGRQAAQLRRIMHDGEHRILAHLNGTPARLRVDSGGYAVR
jgi:hypothetical protein